MAQVFRLAHIQQLPPAVVKPVDAGFRRDGIETLRPEALLQHRGCRKKFRDGISHNNLKTRSLFVSRVTQPVSWSTTIRIPTDTSLRYNI
ncbi:MAG: hypothetical protein WD035_05900 [Balneolaceae bacterium]